jgi:hypothetical protein
VASGRGVEAEGCHGGTSQVFSGCFPWFLRVFSVVFVAQFFLAGNFLPGQCELAGLVHTANDRVKRHIPHLHSHVFFASVNHELGGRG